MWQQLFSAVACMICVLILAALPVAMIVIGEYDIIVCHVHVHVCAGACVWVIEKQLSSVIFYRFNLY